MNGNEVKTGGFSTWYSVLSVVGLVAAWVVGFVASTPCNLATAAENSPRLEDSEPPPQQPSSQERTSKQVAVPSFSGDGRLFPPDFFGLHIHRATTIPWPSVQFSGWRLWDTYTNWLSIEPTRGQFQFSKLDALVDLAAVNGKEIILTLGMTPAWASIRPDEPCPYAKGCAAPPKNLADWDNYVRTVVTRYRGRIAYYEVWNEPTFSDMQPFSKGFFSGSTVDMVALARIAYTTIKEVDPAAKVLSPGFSEEGGIQRLDKFLAAGGRPYVEVVSHHFYRSSPEAIPSLVYSVRQVMTKHGMSEVPLWNTESGYLVQNRKKDVKPWRPEPWSWSSRVLSQDDEAAIIPRAFALGFWAGVSRYYWFAWDNGVMGIAEDEGKREGPAVQGWQRSTQWFTGSRLVGCGSTNKKLWVCELKRDPNRKAWLVWHTEGSLVWRVPANWNATFVEKLMEGESRSIEEGTFEINEAPVLMKTEATPWRN